MTRYIPSSACEGAARPPLLGLLFGYCLVVTGGFLSLIPLTNGRSVLLAIPSKILGLASSSETSTLGCVSLLPMPVRLFSVLASKWIIAFWSSTKLTCSLTLGLILIRSTTSFRMAATTVSVSSRSPAVRQTCRADSRPNRLSTTRTYGSLRTGLGSRPALVTSRLLLSGINGACTELMARRT